MSSTENKIQNKLAVFHEPIKAWGFFEYVEAAIIIFVLLLIAGFVKKKLMEYKRKGSLSASR